LVCITQYHPDSENKVGPPLAVGRMALPSDEIKDVEKGKAVYVLHTWKDCLWEMGDRRDIPEFAGVGEAEKEQAGEGEQESQDESPSEETKTLPSGVPDTLGSTLSPQGKRAHPFTSS